MSELANIPWNLIMPLIVLQFILMIVALVDVIRHRADERSIYHVDFHHRSWQFDWINSVLYLREAASMTFLLQVDNLTKKYADNNVVDAVSFELEEHTATALIGPNGAGKTTTLSMLAGLVSPTSGAIQFQGDAKQDIRSIIGFLPQYPKFFPWLSALEFTEMAARLSGVETKQATMEAKKTLEFVGLGDADEQKDGYFFRGNETASGACASDCP